MSVSLTEYPFRKRTFNPEDVILTENDSTCCIVRRVCINKSWAGYKLIGRSFDKLRVKKIQRLQSLVSILLLHIVLLTTILSTICRTEIFVRMYARIAHLLGHRLGHVATVRSHSQQPHDYSLMSKCLRPDTSPWVTSQSRQLRRRERHTEIIEFKNLAENVKLSW